MVARDDAEGLVQYMVGDLRQTLDRAVQESGRYQGMLHLLESVGSVLKPGIGFAMRPNDYPVAEDAPVRFLAFRDSGELVIPPEHDHYGKNEGRQRALLESSSQMCGGVAYDLVSRLVRVRNLVMRYEDSAR